MRTINKLTLVLVSVLGSLTGSAQQDPMYTHYMDNTLVINPAYAGSRDAFTVNALHRSQWVDFKGAPKTQTIMFHTPLKNEHIGMGLSVYNDKIGPTNKTAIIGDFAYRMKLNEKSKLALGLSAGANIFQSNLSALQLDQQTDPSFQTNISNRITPNIGFGAYYHRERFYGGISIPNLLENKIAEIKQVNGNSLISREQRHYFLIAGSIFHMTDNLSFKPTTMIKITAAAPIQMDFTATFIIKKKLLLGAMYRTGDAVGALVGFNITEQLHIGYSYDWSLGLKTPTYNKGSHEIMLRYDYLSAIKKQIHTPRHF